MTTSHTKDLTNTANAQEQLDIQERATDFLQQNIILTSPEIRRASVNSKISKLDHLAHERLNEYCKLTGWDGEREERNPIDLSEEQTQHAQNLIDQYADANSLAQQRRGWLAIHFPDIADMLFTTLKTQAEQTEAEPESLDNDKERGQVLNALIQATQGTIFTKTALANTLIQTLTHPNPNGETFLGRMKAGALGLHAYKSTRFLGRNSEPDAIIAWCARFINEYYPAHIAKTPKKDEYILEPDSPPVFMVWMKHRLGLTELKTPHLTTVETEKKKAVKKAKVMKTCNKTQREIAKATGLTRRQVRDNTTHIPAKER